MKNLIRILCLTFLITGLKATGQNYLISFEGSGAATTLSAVKVENLTAGTSLLLNGTDILRLTTTTGVYSIDSKKNLEIKIYPNPMTDNSTILICPPVSGPAVVTVSEMTGKPVAQIRSTLEAGEQEFRLSGIEKGFYIITVRGETYQFSGKLMSRGSSKGNIKMEQLKNTGNLADNYKGSEQSKGSFETIDMEYTLNDILKFSAVSGSFSTILTDSPTQDKTIMFDLVACTDADNNNYPVIRLGTQTWMGENLKTTRYQNAAEIPLIESNTEWSNLTTPGYCWYNNDEATFKPHYGALYNWYVIGSGEICPIGWHTPSNTELGTLMTYAGGESIAGGRLKETGTSKWLSPNTGATNETGFTALPGDARYIDGTFKFLGAYCHWWSSTEENSTNSWLHYLMNDWDGAININADKRYGLSVRCILNPE